MTVKPSFMIEKYNYKYRFKTEEELKKEYGSKWRRKAPFNSDGAMDYLFGAIVKRALKAPTGRGVIFGIYDDKADHVWYVTKEMVTSDIEPSYKPKKFIYG